MEQYRVPVSAEDRLRAGLAIHMVAARTGVQADVVSGGGRTDPAASRARWMAMYLAHISFSWSLERVGHAFGLNRSTVSAACRWAEDARDRPQVDALLTQLEQTLAGLVDAPVCEMPR